MLPPSILRGSLLACCLACAPFGADALAASLSTMPANECDISSSNNATNACVNGEQYAGVGPNLNAGSYTATMFATRSIAGTSARNAIDAWGTARYIDNTSNNSIFIPFKTALECFP